MDCVLNADDLLDYKHCADKAWWVSFIIFFPLLYLNYYIIKEFKWIRDNINICNPYRLKG